MLLFKDTNSAVVLSHSLTYSSASGLLSSYPLKAEQREAPLLQVPSVDHSQLSGSQCPNTLAIIVFRISVADLVPAAHLGIVPSEGESNS